MHSISNSDGYGRSSDESWETGDSKSTVEDKQFIKDLINKANSVPLVHIFKLYNVKASEYNKMVICPFIKHSGGRERTPSFKYFHDNNSFHCFGCGSGGHNCKFVSIMDNISITAAASKILELYESEASIDNNENLSTSDYSERLEIIMEFSNLVREFIQKNSDNVNNIQYIEMVAKVFDDVCSKHKLDNLFLKNFINELAVEVDNHKST